MTDYYALHIHRSAVTEKVHLQTEPVLAAEFQKIVDGQSTESCRLTTTGNPLADDFTQKSNHQETDAKDFCNAFLQKNADTLPMRSANYPATPATMEEKYCKNSTLSKTQIFADSKKINQKNVFLPFSRKEMFFADPSLIPRKITTIEAKGNPCEADPNNVSVDDTLMAIPCGLPLMSEELIPITPLPITAPPPACHTTALLPPVQTTARLSQDIEALAELLERHAVRVFASEGARTGDTGGQVILHFSGQYFAETSLLLTKCMQGWALHPLNAGENELLSWKRNAHRLTTRFAEKGLGKLDMVFETQPHFRRLSSLLSPED